MRTETLVIVWWLSVLPTGVVFSVDEEGDEEDPGAAVKKTIKSLTSSRVRSVGCCGLDFNPASSLGFDVEESICSLEAELDHLLTSHPPQEAAKLAKGADAILNLIRKKSAAEKLAFDLENRFVEAVLAFAKADLISAKAVTGLSKARERGGQRTLNSTHRRITIRATRQDLAQILEASALSAAQLAFKIGQAKALNLKRTVVSIRESARKAFLRSKLKTMIAYIGLAVHDLLKDDLPCVYPLLPKFLKDIENMLYSRLEKDDLIPYSSVLETKLYFEET